MRKGRSTGGQQAGRGGVQRLCVVGLVGLFLVCLAPPVSAQVPSRGYELVSPQDKNGGDLNRDTLVQDWATSAAAEGGGAVAYSGSSQFADIASGAPYAQYVSTRTSTGWLTHGINPRFEAETLEPGVLDVTRVPLLSTDLRRALAITNVRLTEDAAALSGSWGLYSWDASAPDWRLVSKPWTTLPPDDGNGVRVRFEVAGASDDMSTVVFTSQGRQLTEDGPPPGGTGSASAVYKWSNGNLEFVSELPNGEPAAKGFGGARAVSLGSFHPGDHLVSNDGHRVFFSDEFANSTLYVREDGTTIPVSVSERAGANPLEARPAVFWAAEAESGTRALFSSGEQLTEDSAVQPGAEDVYLWDRTAPEGQRITDLTTGAPGGGGVAPYLGLAAASDDLEHVYFVASGALTGEARAGEPNLYEWTEAGGVHYIATLNGLDFPVWSFIRASPVYMRYRDARTTADGSQLAFVSAAQLTNYDNAGTRQVYLYDAVSQELSCVSCDQSKPASTSDAVFFPAKPGLASFPSNPPRLPRNLSADGRSVIFETDQALVERDANGKSDVYEWRQGELSLISSGQGARGSQFVDASADGRDVFFITRERLVKADQDDQADMYDARVGGGFPDSEPPLLCEGDACQGPGPIPPAFAGPATSTFLGGGNTTPPKKGSKSRRAKRCARGFVRKQGKGKARAQCVPKHKSVKKRGRRR